MNTENAEITLDQMLACVDREIGMRTKVYPRWVEQKKMLPGVMLSELARMRAVREQLIRSQAMMETLLRLTGEGVVSAEKLRDMIETAEAEYRVRLNGGQHG